MRGPDGIRGGVRSESLSTTSSKASESCCCSWLRRSWPRDLSERPRTPSDVPRQAQLALPATWSHLEIDLFAFGQHPKAAPLDNAEVHEEIAFMMRDHSPTTVLKEPPHLAVASEVVRGTLIVRLSVIPVLPRLPA